MILNSPFGLVNKISWKLKLSVTGLLLTSQLVAAPSPVDDEDFLLFLADSFEQDGELVDPLSMIEQDTKDEPNESKDARNEKEANHE